MISSVLCVWMWDPFCFFCVLLFSVVCAFLLSLRKLEKLDCWYGDNFSLPETGPLATWVEDLRAVGKNNLPKAMRTEMEAKA